MKTCNNCSTQVDDNAKFCPTCGSSNLVAQDATIQQFDQVQTNTPVYNPAYQMENTQSYDEENSGSENVLAGIVGAFLFSIIGGLLYFVIYQAGIIAGVCGLVIFILANFGYGLFAKTKNKASMVGLIASIVAMVVMIYAAEYFCISFEIFQVYKDQGITIFDAIRVTPEFLAEPEIGEAVAEDLVYAYIFGFVATISNIVNIVKARKKKQ